MITVIAIGYAVIIIILRISRTVIVLVPTVVIVVPVVDAIFIKVGLCQRVPSPDVVEHHGTVEHPIVIKVVRRCSISTHGQRDMPQVDHFSLAERQTGPDPARGIAESNGCNHLISGSFSGNHHKTNTEAGG